MKKLIIILCMFLAATALHARAIQEDYRNAEEKERVSYAFGMIIGANLSTAPIDFDYAAFTEGLRSMLDENIESQFSQQEAMEIVETALHIAMDKVTEENRRLEEEFLLTNSQRTGVRVTESGLQYEVLKHTSGDKPAGNAVVKVNYTGTFIDGSLFDSSAEDEGAYIPIELVIPGWTEGIMLMSESSVYRLFIPSNLAYGRDGIQGLIPPYSTLIFEVELLEIINVDDDE